MSEARKYTNKLKKIRDLCLQFDNSLRHKSFKNKIDEARTKSLIHDIQKVLWHEEYSDKPHYSATPKDDWEKKREEEQARDRLPDDEQKKLNLERVRSLRKKMKNG